MRVAIASPECFTKISGHDRVKFLWVRTSKVNYDDLSGALTWSLERIDDIDMPNVANGVICFETTWFGNSHAADYLADGRWNGKTASQSLNKYLRDLHSKGYLQKERLENGVVIVVDPLPPGAVKNARMEKKVVSKKRVREPEPISSATMTIEYEIAIVTRECIICSNDIPTDSAECVFTVPCQHGPYCRDCMNKWATNGNEPQCPECRTFLEGIIPSHTLESIHSFAPRGTNMADLTEICDTFYANCPILPENATREQVKAYDDAMKEFLK